MAKRAALKARIRFNKDGLKAMLGFIRILKKRLAKVLRERFQDEIQLAVLESQVGSLLETLIYSVYEPQSYERTYALLRSFRATGTGTGDDGGFSVWSDPDIAPSKTDPSLSYAAFFEEPDEFKTFIQPRGVGVYPINKRPFFNALTKLTMDFSNTRAQDAVIEAILQLMPKEVQV